ncbi:MAG: branched-chain amino acid transaminase [Minisyncoccales bacterium]
MEGIKKIWYNGQFLDFKKGKIFLLSHALHYGSAVFEGIRAYLTEKGPAVFRLDDHLKRLFFSASCLRIKIPFSFEELKKAILKTIELNGQKECYIRPIVFYGEGSMGLYPKEVKINCAIITWPWGKYLEKEKVKVKVSRFIRLHPRSVESKAKISGYYVNSIFASLEAKEKGYDEALLLDYRGFLAEGPGENIFIVKNKKVFTPALGSILPGITRKTVIEILRDLKIPCQEKNISLTELKEAQEAFFTGTAVEICPIYQVGKKKIEKGKIGPFSQMIKEKYQRIVHGREKKYLKWLTFVKN